jgi:hypothetical protein
LAAARQRLEKLAGVRAEYATLVAEVKHHTSMVEAARRELAEARGSKAGAHSSSLISRIDGPDTGVWPMGPSRSIIALAGVFGGLATGVGILFLTVPSLPAPKQAVKAEDELLRIPERPAAVAGGLSLRQAFEKSLRDKVAL